VHHARTIAYERGLGEPWSLPQTSEADVGTKTVIR
jgi:hypothetical protein